MNNKHMEFGKSSNDKTMKDLRGLANSLRNEKEDQPTLQQDQLTLLVIKKNSTI